MKRRATRRSETPAAKEKSRPIGDRTRQHLAALFMPHVKRSAEERERLSAELAKEREERKHRNARLTAERKAKDKLREADVHLETGLGLLLEVLWSDNLPIHKAGDLHGDYFTSDAITALARHGEQIIVELCKLAEAGNQDAIRQAWESASLLAEKIQNLAESKPELLKRVARSSEAMPVLWYRKRPQNVELPKLAKKIGLGSELTEDLEGKSNYEAANAKIVRRWLKRWYEIERNLSWRRKIAQKCDASGDFWICEKYDENGAGKGNKRVSGRVPDKTLLRRAYRSGVVSDAEVIWFERGLMLQKLVKNEKSSVKAWVDKVVLPWVKANKEAKWLKKLVPDGKFASPWHFAQVLTGRLKPS